MVRVCRNVSKKLFFSHNNNNSNDDVDVDVDDDDDDNVISTRRAH